MPKLDDRFPWDAALQFGFGILNLAPRDFWKMTPLELNAAMRAHGVFSAKPILRSELQSMMSKFPDGAQIQQKDET